jgi:hypothetical protein
MPTAQPQPYLVHDRDLTSRRAVRVTLPFPPPPVDVMLVVDADEVATGILPTDLDRLKAARPDFVGLLDYIVGQL